MKCAANIQFLKPAQNEGEKATVKAVSTFYVADLVLLTFASTPIRLRHKIEKASAAKQRKQRKQARKNPEWRSKLKKDPGIPNLFPYKDKLLRDIEAKKQAKFEEQERIQELARARRNGTAVDDVQENDDAMDEDEDFFSDEEVQDEEMVDQGDSNPMAALLASARARATVYEKGRRRQRRGR